ncbi:glycoside hydrolase family 5 protein [Rhizobium sp. TH2]|uniref:glycoside hydrolase family 5 protein n=1 Tax=Rhizobium sp. TH2 TaxID=2775403 RepID=UPI0021582F30|nr:glycoside hydrolase family 5 protein [Rhizobium sp. TH2]
MKRLLCACAVLLAMAASGEAAALKLSRGVGVHEWLNWSPLADDGTYRWPPYRPVEAWLSGGRPLRDWPPGDQFARIRSMGFDFIRLSVDPGPLLASKGKRRKQALKVLERAIKHVTAADLKVVLDLHSVSQVPAYGIDLVNGPADSEGIAQYRAMVKDVAAMLANTSTGRVALEPYNEPAHYPCDASGTDDWQRIISGTVADIRSVSRDLPIVVTGGCGGSITGLTDIDPAFDDPNIYYSFHMYEPHSFTHQRLDDPKGFSSGLPWPAARGAPEAVVAQLTFRMTTAGLDEAQQVLNMALISGDIEKYFIENWGLPQLQARMGEAVAWAKKHDIPTERLFMGEFGAMLMSADGRSGANNTDRLRYIGAVRREAERFRIPWSIWEYSNPHGMSVIEPRGPAVPDRGLLKTLGLQGGDQ